jgi:hypothetical protein
MLSLLKQSTQRNVQLKLFLSSDSKSPATGRGGASSTVTISKDGGAFAAATNQLAEISGGWYNLTLSAADTNTLGGLIVRVVSAGCDDAERVLQIVAFDPADAAALGLGNLNATITSRLAAAGYTAPESAATIAAAVWGAGTRTLTSFGSLVADIAAAVWGAGARSLTDKADFSLSYLGLTNVADAVLKRDWTEVSGEAARSALNALRALRNRVTRAGTVYREDDATPAWTFSTATDPNADPVTEIDPT